MPSGIVPEVIRDEDSRIPDSGFAMADPEQSREVA
jgi:hypothetical protein